MPKNIFAEARREHNLFRNEKYLYPEFVPERLPHRDAEIDSLVYALNPIARGGKPQNVFVCGGTGVGKTACIKFVLHQLEEHTDRAKHLYLNCFEFNSRHAVLSELANFLGEAVPRRGVATDELYSKLLNALKQASFTPVIVLDEVDQLLCAEDGEKLLYDLLRVIEYQKKGLELILVSNDKALTVRLDPRIRSSLAEQAIEFNPYSPQQLKDILRERAEYAFAPGSLDPEVINVAAAHAAKLGGDARIAIECLWKAGREAERVNAERVELCHLQNAFEAVAEQNLKAVKYLSEHERALLRIIAGKGTLHSGELYQQYASAVKEPVTERRIRDFLANLEAHRLIRSALIDLGNKGKTKEITLAVQGEALLKALDAA
ncbi:MAG: AAA family ATPase [Candidatus Diapherotrites archaeon]|uniref:ORC1-type DNA replication protein n=1 Tax=Candidatus Iainarchaeum sp. TaxID=3101447 RepID=A0A8T4LCU2_9ARCH|nr:AAA family ATPase [Candidatus Diapherotrites archaeon]